MAHMTRKTSARIAGFTFLFYIAVGILSMVMFGRVASGTGMTEKLASIAQHSRVTGVVFVLGLLQAFSAITLAVTLYAITREQNQELAMAALVCRVAEGLVGVAVPTSVGLLWLATASGANAPDPVTARALAAFLFEFGVWKTMLSGTFFAVGSMLFSWLLLRGRMIPVALAWLGVVASAILVAALPLQGAGFLRGPITSLMWAPMALFEVPLALWLLVKGVASAAPTQSA